MEADSSWLAEDASREAPVSTDGSDTLFPSLHKKRARSGETEADAEAERKPGRRVVSRSDFVRTVAQACHAALEACPEDMMPQNRLVQIVSRSTQPLFDACVADAALMAIDIAVAAGAFVRHHTLMNKFLHRPLDTQDDCYVRAWVGLASRRCGTLQTAARAARHRQLGNIFDVTRNALLENQTLVHAVRAAARPEPGTAVFLVRVPRAGGDDRPLFVYDPSPDGVSVLALAAPPRSIERVA